jgi:hypothetical protein
MILECAQCKRLYDVSDIEPGAAVACECGDALLVPDLEIMEEQVLVENYMKRLAADHALNPEQITHGEAWELQRGSARVRVEYDREQDLLTIESAILSLPSDSSRRSQLLGRVMELNYRSTGEARFAIHADQLVVTFSRRAAGLDYVEFVSAIDSVCRTADDYDDELKAQFLDAVPQAESDEEIDLSKI